ncbi:peptidoglycan/xylan/chitin deacetylase (PgdA/CDA1 family) [Azospirillum agricola]|uniref:polysaccharide deacetylase family protein n=1 Tax=Azospirillum agricola TaxID=1720247 RepID=UPI001AE567B1|nr:polysaccharide deacetylase family protein [Azospirillum agricola]MBP2231535.1 peptidoglycan/xylan/chitin deacetylase (PgdA/CDA1 family) [Azospirillum agricola]
MTGWRALDAELARWAEAGWRCPLWLRDDDAVAASPELERLLALCASAGIPLGLAAIPADATPSLAEPLADHPDVAILVHGWAHTNHAAPGEKKAEFGAGRPAEARRADAARGLDRLRGLFGDRVLPLFVPPWNRLGRDMPALLVEAGYRAVSGFGRRPAVEAPPGLRWLNTHIDLIDWHGGRSAVDTEALLIQLCRALAERREASGDDPPEAEPIGLLTHHRVHDPAIWRLLEALLDRLAGHPAVTWPAPGSLIGLAPASGPTR